MMPLKQLLSWLALFMRLVTQLVVSDKNQMKVTTLSLSSSQLEEFEQIAKQYTSTSGFKWLSSSEIPTAIPKSLRNKLKSAMLMWERTSSSSVFLVFNNMRFDQKDNSLDQQPFGIVVNSSGASTYGIFIDHGNWQNRTTPITPEVLNILESTSLGNYFPLYEEVSKNSSGSLSDLKNTSHEGAFKEMINRLRVSINQNSA
ncbi:MAG: hypothetical protein A2W63_04730 [Deltaproteobacteria bacterium RIFCSPLOWO2_02_44_9]|nr:MAG: hypothetical protein A2W63_04730 [Deltaproteobacteria bacterium RIFCSPLOWO2_02_44_9]